MDILLSTLMGLAIVEKIWSMCDVTQVASYVKSKFEA